MPEQIKHHPLSEYLKFRYSAPSDSCKCGNCQLIPIATLRYHVDAYTTLRAENEALRQALSNLVNAKALAGVRNQVAGWNGEGRPDGPFKERHPIRLGATLPKTNCGAVYELDEAMQAARTALAQSGERR